METAKESNKYLPHGSKSAIAKEAGLSVRTVTSYFKGKEVSLDTLEKIEAVAKKYYTKTKVA